MPSMSDIKLYVSLFLLASVGFGNVCAQELPPIQGFTPQEYNSGNQNWSISQSRDKVIYVANNKGLLQYNGADWKLYPSPNETIMRSVKVVGEKIYTGCYQEFGYWTKNELNQLDYTSLSDQLDTALLEDEEFWNIMTIDGWVAFQSLKRIYIYDAITSELKIINSKEVISKIFKVKGKLFFQRLNDGIYKIENGFEKLVTSDRRIVSQEVAGIFQKDNRLLFASRNQGFFSFNPETGQMEPWGVANDELSELTIYRSIQLKNNDFALGTISDGLVYLNENGDITYKINQPDGLLNNTVLSLYEDLDGNIWMGLDNGINYINVNAPIRFFKDHSGKLGSVYTTAVFDEKLYLGTNQGLFVEKLNASASHFTLVPGTQGQVWSLNVIDNELFCCHDNGTFLIDEDAANLVSELKGCWGVKPVKGTDLLIQGNYDGLYILSKESGNWSVRNRIKGFDNSSRYFEIMGNEVFVNHEYQGVFRLTLDEKLSEAKEVKAFKSLKGANSGLLANGGQLLYAYRQGILKYADKDKGFVKDTTMSGCYTPSQYVSGRMIPSATGDGFWLFTRDRIIQVTSGSIGESVIFKDYPIYSSLRKNVTEYENIIHVANTNQYLIGSTKGYMKINLSGINIKNFSISIDQIAFGSNKEYGQWAGSERFRAFKSKNNYLKLSYYAPEYYQYFPTKYQYRLVNQYPEWSSWTEKPEIFFENLSPGEYSFEVRAKIGDKLSDNVATYSFEILKPWYATNAMITLYSLGFIVLVVLVHLKYKRYYRKQRERLVEEKEKEIKLNQLRNERELIKVKNQQLEQDFKSKSKELAASTMSIVRKNELLTEIKELLLKNGDKEQLSTVFKIIDKSLNPNENWEFFQEAFNNADSDFFHKLKRLHPDLSPNDLKLCAYLRLNLSSKEIAQLINISPKSVEIKRYRLRKKLNLESHENLIDHILNI